MKAKVFFDEIDPKYKKLVEMYSLAYLRAAEGKGHEHHSLGEPYDQQYILRGTRMFGIGGPQFQIGKKNEQIGKRLKSINLDIPVGGPTDAGSKAAQDRHVELRSLVAEFLDIMNYSAAGAIRLLELDDYEFYSSNIPEEQ